MPRMSGSGKFLRTVVMTGVGRRLPVEAGVAKQPFVYVRSLSTVCFGRAFGTAAPGQERALRPNENLVGNDWSQGTADVAQGCVRGHEISRPDLRHQPVRRSARTSARERIEMVESTHSGH